MESKKRSSRPGFMNVIRIVYVRHFISRKSNQQSVLALQWFVNYTASLLVIETNIVSWWLFLCQLLGANNQSIIVSPYLSLACQYIYKVQPVFIPSATTVMLDLDSCVCFREDGQKSAHPQKSDSGPGGCADSKKREGGGFIWRRPMDWRPFQGCLCPQGLPN